MEVEESPGKNSPRSEDKAGCEKKKTAEKRTHEQNVDFGNIIRTVVKTYEIIEAATTRISGNKI